MASVLEPFDLGPIPLSNRLVMGPMTRARSGDDGVANAMMADYYAQRASAGLIITEGVFPEINAQGYFATPGIETEAQTAGWKAVTDAVHAKGGKIFLQLMHCGRVGVPANNGGHQLVAPSAIAADFQILTRSDDGLALVPMAMPRELSSEEVDGVLDGMERAARNAKAAGFDGIELHAASGYLPNQFLSTNSNLRTDKWGGSPEKRTRFTIEAMERLFKVFGSERAGIKIAPRIKYNGLDDAEVEPTYDSLVRQLDAMKPAYLHFQTTLSYEHLNSFEAVGSTEGQIEVWHHWPYQFLRDRFTGTIIASGDLTLDLAQKTLDAGMADLFVFGRRYIANPDLFERFKAGAELADPNLMTFYGGGEAGYTDYPTMTA